MEGHENGKTMWRKSIGMMEARTIGLGWEGENWNDLYYVFQIPLGGRVARTMG
jgi:hypothetical protein